MMAQQATVAGPAVAGPTPEKKQPGEVVFFKDNKKADPQKKKAKVAKAKILAMVAFPPEKEQTVWLGKKIAFAYSVSHLCLLSFTFSWMDTVSFARFGVYITLQTGNFVNSSLRVDGASNCSVKVISVYMMIICAIFGVFIGPWFSCSLLEYFNSREKAYVVIVTSMSVAFICIDFIVVSQKYKKFDGDDHEVLAVVMAFFGGALVHWAQKLTYTTMLMTLNLVKLSEFMYRLLRDIAQGGARLRGDMIIVTSIVISFITASFIAGAVYLRTDYALCPLAALLPLHLWLGNCFPETINFSLWVLFKRQCCSVKEEEETSKDLESGMTQRRDDIPNPICAGGIKKGEMEVESSVEDNGGTSDKRQSAKAAPRSSRRHSFFLPVVKSRDEIEEEEAELAASRGSSFDDNTSTISAMLTIRDL